MKTEMKKVLITIFVSVLLYVPYIQAEPPLYDTNPALITPLPSRPAYPAESSKNKEEGTVLIVFTVNKTGKVENVSIKKSSGYPALDKSALVFVNKLKFNPAIKNGMPVNSRFTLPVNFRLHE